MIVSLLAALTACSSAANPPLTGQPLASTNRAPFARAHGATVPAGFTLKTLAKGTKKMYNPDPIVVQGKFVYVSFQNATQPTGTGGNSTIAQFNTSGKLLQTIAVPGRCDGMRWNPYTNLMWITVNEDANSSMFTWNPAKSGASAVTPYKWSSAKHGGGYDDLAFTTGKAFVAASNPKLNAAGKNLGPAMVMATLNGTTAVVKPVLMGNAKAKNIVTGQTETLNITDPDSMTVTPTGAVLLVSQGDSDILFIQNPGLSNQSVSVLPVGTQLDDTVYATTKNGLLYVVDAVANAIYTIRGPLVAGGLYTEAPSDSGVAGFAGMVNPTTGTVTPMFTGFGSPTGLFFAK
jgi:hypothetical protein